MCPDFFKEVKNMNCIKCGKFMWGGEETDNPLEDEVVKWWFCSCGIDYPEHLFFKSSIKHRRRMA